ncbi:S-adenosyl-L-methionine-dependent methyltransferase [Coniochaeta ligniaria NRRL 30616]|uniref:S-adenosyl-L-methionine-dependent methyltransferase n=1 Tax=Coniochaeta ligniaria NRRL 30616 TaxID=1408157 RepID=A0A1J7JIJ9_9PEZI|nr:S-adenosyl-L-methionine-dependent methyltransferase [Coniochaeta ligniaria NRRL 30616]
MADLILRPPEELQKCLLENDRRPDPDHTLAAIKHRQRLVRFWGVTRGASVLEIGCGQGDCTVVLADAVGSEGTVVGIDPGADDYGTPSLRAAHKHVKASVVGKQIEFVRSDAAGYLTSPTVLDRYDFIVLSHCVWYLAEPGLLTEIFELAYRYGRAPTVLLAEYGSVTSVPAAIPHVLAAVAVNALESLLRAPSFRNIKCTATPRQMRDAAAKGGWVMSTSEFLEPEEAQRDGWREVVMILEKPYSKMFEDHVESLDVGEKTKSMLLAARDAVHESVQRVDGGLAKIRNMDVWAARFELAEASS